MPLLHRTTVTAFFLFECLVLAQCWIVYQPSWISTRSSLPVCGRSSISSSSISNSISISISISSPTSRSRIAQSHHSWSTRQYQHSSSSKTVMTMLYAKSNKNGGSGSGVSTKRSKKHNKTPKLIIFDLDGCLWSPEMYEILYFMGGRGSPFTPDDKDPRILRTAGGSEVKLLGNVRGIFYELQYSEQWWDTNIGISSRTDQPEWARELLEKFIIFSDDCNHSTCSGGGNAKYKYPPFPMKQVLTPEICELAKDSKVQHFERILKNAPGKPKYQDCLFFDNELGNCREVAKLGVTVCYCPKGVTQSDWDEAIKNFPCINGKIIRK